MKILAERIKGKDLKPGELFSTEGQTYWDMFGIVSSVGERVYIRTPSSAPLGTGDQDIYRITILKNNTLLVSAFPGTGKSWFAKNSYIKCCSTISGIFDQVEQLVMDSDSSIFDKKDFPQNYIKHIKKYMGRGIDIMCISSHEEVRKALVDSGLDFVLVYPEVGLKTEYLQRFADRGSPVEFLNLLDRNWIEWIQQLQVQPGCRHIILKSGEYLSDRVSEFRR